MTISHAAQAALRFPGEETTPRLVTFRRDPSRKRTFWIHRKRTLVGEILYCPEGLIHPDPTYGAFRFIPYNGFYFLRMLPSLRVVDTAPTIFEAKDLARREFEADLSFLVT